MLVDRGGSHRIAHDVSFCARILLKPTTSRGPATTGRAPEGVLVADPAGDRQTVEGEDNDEQDEQQRPQEIRDRQEEAGRPVDRGLAEPLALARLPQLACDFAKFRCDYAHKCLFLLQPHSISLCSADLAY